MTTKITLLVGLLLTVTSIIQAQTGKITGRVITPEENQGAMVNIGLEGTNKGTLTNSEGYFEIRNVEPGTYNLRASFIGLGTKRVNVQVKAGEETVVPVITLIQNNEELEEVVVTGSSFSNYSTDIPSEALKIQTPLIETPQNIQVITKDLITDQQVIDMLEGITRNTSGAMMVEHWGTFARINMRGFKLPAFRNGMNVDLPWGPLTEDLSVVDRIEFVKGPAGFMLSSGEPGGFYNVELKKPTATSENEVSLMYGSFNTLRATADLGGKLSKDGKLLYRLNLMGSTKQSHRDYEYNDRYTIHPSFKYRFDERTSLTAEYLYQHSQLAVVGAAYVFSINDFGSLDRDYSLLEPNIDPANLREHNAFLTFEHQLDENWSLTAKASYLDYAAQGNSMWPDSVTEAGIYRGITINDSKSTGKLGQIFVSGDVKTGAVHHRILAGADLGAKEYYADWFQSAPLDSSLIPLDYENPVHNVPSTSMPVWDRTLSLRKRSYGIYLANQSIRYSALYVQDELAFFDDMVRLTLAGRYTTYQSSIYSATTDDNVFTPRVGLSISLDDNTSVYGLYDQAFVPQSGATKEGEAFEPEKGNDLEFGLKRKWATGRWNSALTVYRITKKNVLTTDPEDVNYSIQLGEAQSKGIEFDLQGEITRGLNLILNYALTNVEITEDTNPEVVGTRLAGHAKHMTNGWLKYQFSEQTLKGVGVALGYQYQVDRSSWAWATDNESMLPDYFRLDGALSWTKNDLIIGLNVNNLLDKYLYSGSAYGSYVYWQTEPGTNFRLNVSYKF